jgi:hypothetical protein
MQALAPAPKRVLALRLALVLGSVAAGLLAAEGLARLRTGGGAGRFLDLFEADSRYGVRLRASARTRLRSPRGRITEIATNALGFRGPEWPEPAPGAVLLLGDSQMMGFGVPFADGAARQLERRLRVPVLPAAVPSWGPHEYVLATSDLVPRLRPRWVVFVGNLTNDWFEASVPNRRRTTAQGGFAVGVRGGRPAPSRPRAPSRAARRATRRGWLGRSQLLAALRDLAGTRHSELLGRGGRELATLRPPADAALRLVRDVDRLVASARPHRSRLTPFLLAADRICRRHGCEVVAAALPLDVQASGGAWRKYASAPVDLAPTERLLADLVADAREADLRAVDLLAPLRASGEGAFLPDDYHLSPRGHAAVAAALASLIAAPRTQTAAARPAGGRSR